MAHMHVSLCPPDTSSMAVRIVHVHGAPSLHQLLNDVAEVIPAKWRPVGIQLKLSPDNLDNIQSEHGWKPNPNKHCFEQVFKEWRKKDPQSFSWTELIEALEKPAVAENDLANKLRNKHASHAAMEAQGLRQLQT